MQQQDPLRRYRKFKLARSVAVHIQTIEAENARLLKSQDPGTRALAACAALIIALGIRPGGRSRRAVGAISLRGKHISTKGEGANRMTIAFEGKDGIPFYRKFHARPALISVLSALAETSGPSRLLFEGLTLRVLRHHLTTLNPDLTPRLIRTIRANQVYETSFARAQQKGASTKDATLAAETETARFLNHVRNGRLAVATSRKHYIDPLLAAKTHIRPRSAISYLRSL